MAFFILLLSVLLSIDSIGKEFKFNKGLGGAASWGSGSFEMDSNGASEKGSVKMMTDFGEEQTLYFYFDDLKPGLYQLSAMLKGSKIQKGKYYSFRAFYDNGSGIKDIFQNETGSFDWSKMTQTFKVKKSLKLWFRLNSPGTLWVDNVLLKETSKHLPFSFSKTKVSTLKNKKAPKVVMAKKKELIFDSVYRAKIGQYINFNASLLEDYNFTKYDRIGFNLSNPTDSNYLLYFTIQDTETKGYWTQANFKVLVKPGKNWLEFELRRYQGERGSSKNYKSVNLKSLKKMFVVVDPDGQGEKTSKEFVFTDFTLLPQIYPKAPPFVKVFNFAKLRDRDISNYQTITTHSLYNRKDGFGFVAPEYSSVDDSQYSSRLDQSTIDITSGSFRIDLPNDFYHVWVNIEKLGYWDIPFWKKREVSINSQPFIKEQRDSFERFLEDYFRFEFVSFQDSQNPYELFMSSIFKFYKTKVRVTDKKIILKFSGDKTAISLNSLVLFPINKGDQANSFLDQLSSAKELDYSKLASSLDETKKLKEVQVEVLGRSLGLSAQVTHKDIELSSVKGEEDFSLIKISNNSVERTFNFSFEDDKSFEVYEVKKQLASMTMNHESYQLAPKIIGEKLLSKKLTAFEVLYILVKNKAQNSVDKIKSRTSFSIKGDDFTWSASVIYKYIPLSLEKPDFPVGFIGLDPFPKVYFEDPKVLAFTQKLRMKSLRELSKRGFTTFSGLPSIEQSKELSEVLAFASQNQMDSVFTYLGAFSVESQSDYEVYQKLSKAFGVKIYQSFSDEAQGYSNKVDEDVTQGLRLKKNFPKLLLSGFGEGDQSLYKLNKFFDLGLYSSIEKSQTKKLKGKWGAYNGSVKPVDNPEYTFGFWLYKARKNGLKAYLDWHLAAVQNYPYFELDGRETDVFMIYPKSSGSIATALKFELATRGLYTYRKLVFLEKSKSKSAVDLLKAVSTLKLNKLDPREKISPKSLDLLNKKLESALEASF